MYEQIKAEDIVLAHKFSSCHKNELIKGSKCGCFYCLEIFNPKEIKAWASVHGGSAAICPYCGVDSVIGESSGYPITKDFLQKMKDYWF